MSKEPTRLIESDSGALAEDIAALRRQLPSAERLDAIAARLAAAGAGDTGAPASPAPLPPEWAPPRRTRRLDSGTKLVIVALLAGAGLVASAVWWRGPDTAVEVRLPPAVTPGEPATPAMPGATTTATAGAEVATPGRIAAPGVNAPGTAASGIDDHPGTNIAAPSTGSPALTAPLPGSPREPAAPTARAEPDATHAAPRATARAGDASNPGGPLAESTVVVSEVELLKEARSALASDPVQAFTLTERCRAQYPNGGFSQEREFIAISALVRMGRADEARSRVSLFRMHYPSSAYLPRLTRMLSNE